MLLICLGEVEVIEVEEVEEEVELEVEEAVVVEEVVHQNKATRLEIKKTV